jgi:hypothetical protein
VSGFPTAGDHQRVVVGSVGLLGELVNLVLVGLVVVVEALELAGLDRDQLRRRAGFLERLARLDELDLLDHVRGDDRDLLPLQLLLGHRFLL